MVQDTTNSLLKYVCLIMENCGISLDFYVEEEYQKADKATWLRDVVAVVIHDIASGLEVSIQVALLFLISIITFFQL